DIDGDGYNDLVIVSGNQATAQVFRNGYAISNTLDFSSVINIPVGYEQDACALGDVNGDGRPDLAFSVNHNWGTGGAPDYGFYLFSNTSTPGNIRFNTDKRVLKTGLNSFAQLLAIADLNADGKQDVLAGATNTAWVGLYRNTLQFPPVITSFSPLKAAPGTSVTITGERFNSNPADNFVYFG